MRGVETIPTKQPDIRGEVEGKYNAEMNLAVSAEIKAEHARRHIQKLEDLREQTGVAEQLELREAGNQAVLNEAATAALVGGESSSSVRESVISNLAEIKADQGGEVVEGLEEINEKLAKTRLAYITKLSKKGSLRNRKEYKEELAHLQDEYNLAFTNRVNSLMTQGERSVRDPYIPEVMNAATATPASLEGLSENQMHVLVDQIAREATTKSRLLAEVSSSKMQKVFGAFQKSRSLRIVTGAAIWVGAVASTTKGLIPGGPEAITDALSIALPAVTGFLTSREVVKGLDEQAQKLLKRRELKKDIDTIAKSAELTDLTLRTVYSGVEYQGGIIKDRKTDGSEAQNRKAIGNIDSQFIQLESEGSRGGKPYNADMALSIASDIYVDRKDEVDAIMNSDDPKQAFIDLAAVVIEQRTHQFTKENQKSRSRKILINGLALIASTLLQDKIESALDAHELTASVTKPRLRTT